MGEPLFRVDFHIRQPRPQTLEPFSLGGRGHASLIGKRGNEQILLTRIAYCDASG